MMTSNISPGKWKLYFVRLANLSDNFISNVIVQLSNLQQLEFFKRPTDRPTNLLIEAPFRSIKSGGN